MIPTEFLARLTGVETSNKGWNACCPAHEDAKPSLSVSIGKGGRLLIHCHAGCQTTDIIAKLGLKMSDLSPPRPAISSNGKADQIAATYNYTDEHGTLLFQCVRFVPKAFRQRRPDPTSTDRWIWNLEITRRVLYRLPEIIKAVNKGQQIFVVEGEKDVDRLAKAGLAATCNPMGAGKWLREHTETLRGAASVIVIADKDTPGRNHARAVATDLQMAVKSVRMIELPDHDGRSVKDVADWLSAGGTTEELRTIVDAAGEFSAAEFPLETHSIMPKSLKSEYLGVDALPNVSAGIEWPDPKALPNDLPSVQSFNFNCLPATLRPWLEDVAERMQCPPDYPAVGAWIALGSLIGRKVGIRPKQQDDWLVVPNLWGMAVGRPGLMKTPALEQALAPLNRLVAQALEKYEGETRAHKVSEMLNVQRKKLTENAIHGRLKDGDDKGARDLAESNLRSAETAPILRRYKVNDPTVEKLGELLNQNPNGLLLHRDELVGFLRSLDKEGREDSRAFYLEAWNGTGDFTSDRIGRGTVRIEAVTVSIIGAIQPGPLSDYLRQAVRSGAGDDGLLQRFQLAVWPDTPGKWLNVDRWPDSLAKNKAFDVFQYLDNLTAASVQADTSDGIPFLRFAPEAQERFDTWRAELEKKLRSDCDHPAFEAHLAKYRKLVPSLALIQHVANCCVGPVAVGALEQALLWASYLESHARRIYSAVLRPDTASARELGKHLRRGEMGERFTVRETYRKGWTGLSTKEDAEAATEILCDLNWIRCVAGADKPTGRLGSPTFETNPKILHSPRSQLPELTKPPSVAFVSEVAGVSVNSCDASSANTTPGTAKLIEELV